ncbi:MAG: TlpA disulfide reductase family protein [Thermoanaerobaculaceae bacterium]
MRNFLLGLLLMSSAQAADLPRVDFPDLVLYDLNGTPSKLSDYRGLVVVLNFWATWCGPCRMELPELQKLYNKLGGKGLVVLAVNVDTYKQAVPSFVERMKLSLPVFVIEPQVEQQLGIATIPFTVILDKQGRAVRAYPGFSSDGMEDLHRLAEKLLAEKPAKRGRK